MIYTLYALALWYIGLWILWDLPKYWPEPLPSFVVLSFGAGFLLLGHLSYKFGEKVRSARYQGIAAIECGTCGGIMPNTCEGIAAHKCTRSSNAPNKNV